MRKKYDIMINRTKLKDKHEHLGRIGFTDTVFINESMSPGYKYLHYLCRKLLKVRRIHSHSLFHNLLKTELEARGDINVIEHVNNPIGFIARTMHCWKIAL